MASEKQTRSRAPGAPRADLAFVDLNREFVPQSTPEDPEQAADRSYLTSEWLFGGRQRLDWTRLLEKRRVVILGEAGSGKTWEMREQVRKLCVGGAAAFFVRLDLLAHDSCRIAFGEEQWPVFERWHSASSPGFFFLDSVDEAKLDGIPAFHRALRKFREALSVGDLRRARIFLSTRVSEWHHDTDLTFVTEQFDSGRSEEIVDTDKEEGASTRSVGREWDVVKLVALGREQVEKLAHNSGIGSAEAFIAEIDRARAWEFARRPSDVQPLFRLWQQKGCIGTLTQLIEFDLTVKLRETREKVSDPLSDEAARHGAEALAAGCVLCHEPAIRIPMVQSPSDGLDGRLCVPGSGWKDDEYDALLRRPVFDDASLGRVRFHHRRVREFLAARWIERCMREGCSLDELEDVFFDWVGGARVLRTSLAPVAAWLCAGNQAWNAEMRRLVLLGAPEIVLRYGDPKALDTSFCRDLLAILTALGESAKYLWLNTDDDVLLRFADVELAAEIGALAGNGDLAADLRLAMIEIIRLGKITQCHETLFGLIESPSVDDRLRGYAVRAVAAAAEDTGLQRLRTAIAADPGPSQFLTSVYVDVLFPRYLDVSSLLHLLLRTKGNRGVLADITWQVKGTLSERLSGEDALTLIGELARLLSEPPHAYTGEREIPISDTHGWLRPILQIAVEAALSKDSFTESQAELVARSIALLGGSRDDSERSEPIDKKTWPFPRIRRAYFWILIGELRRRREDEPKAWFNVTLGMDSFLKPGPHDYEWLLDDAQNRKDADDRLLAFRLALDLSGSSGSSRTVRRALVRIAKRESVLLDEYRRVRRTERLRPLRRGLYRIKDTVGSDYWWRRRVRDIQRLKAKLRDKFYLWRRLGSIRRGESVRDLSWLVEQAERSNRNRWAPTDWSDVGKAHGKRVAQAGREGCKAFWPRYVPNLPHEKSERNVTAFGIIVGLAGLQAEWKDGKLDFSRLCDDRVRLITRYAVHEINGFPDWYNTLTLARPGPVGDVLIECLAGEWLHATKSDDPEPSVLGKLARQGVEVPDTVRDAILEKLRSGIPMGDHVLGLALGALTGASGVLPSNILDVAETRMRDPAATVSHKARWFGILLQLEGSRARGIYDSVIADSVDADAVVLRTCAQLSSRVESRDDSQHRRAFLNVELLRWFIPVAFRHVRPADDIHREGGGTYTPTARDDAQQFRGSLLRILSEHDELSAVDALCELSVLPTFSDLKDWIGQLRRETLARIADKERWVPLDVREFESEHERSPRTDSDLFRTTLRRLRDIKREVERAEVPLRENLRAGDKEQSLRVWLLSQLNGKSRGRYSATQEAEIDGRKRPDLRTHIPNTTAAVSIEIKWAQDWSFNELIVALESQLVGLYLRAHCSRHGVLVLGIHGGNRTWRRDDERLFSFADLLEELSSRARAIEQASLLVKRVAVVAIDFRDPWTQEEAALP